MASDGITGGETVRSITAPRVDPVNPRLTPAPALDPIQALTQFAEESPAPANVSGLADQLLAWLTPQPRNPDTLSQSRVVPLLGLAADMLARACAADSGGRPSDLSRLGAAALEQELRMQQALADRRATLLRS